MSNSICLSFKICSGGDHRVDFCEVDDESRTSNLASVIRCSISKRWSTACGLMMATVRVALTRGEVGVVEVGELWKASSWLAEMPRSLWSDMVIRKVGCVKRNGKLYHRREEEK